MACNFCNAEIYVKTIQYTKPIAAPVTKVEELRQQLLDLTGEVYLILPKRYCPMCGAKMDLSGKPTGCESEGMTNDK